MRKLWSTSTKKIILVIGGTGAQGSAVVKKLLGPDRISGKETPYTVRILTRDPSHYKIKEDFESYDVEVVQGNVLDFNSVLKALENCYGVFVNTDTFTIGEEAEIFAGMRIFELAKQIGTIKHYIYSSLDYLKKIVNYNPVYRCAHYDGKGPVAEWMQEQPSDEKGMVWSIVTTGPYIETLQGGLLVPRIQEDGTRVFAAPLGKGHLPIVSVDDIGYFARYIFDHRIETSGKDLKIASQMLGWDELVETFKRVTNLPAVYKDLPYDEWVEALPWRDAALATDVPNGITYRDNFRAWWRLYHDDIIKRDMKWIEQVNPERVTVEDWIRKTGYDGTPKPLLKGVVDRFIRPKNVQN
ncbi:unnamed protein product [Adineta steineri]|uniref:NmrA-like family domain-containing protein 1 n=1 Tax=Adineta steineri TaxID=433720 RepID=A0A814JH75_9BILA|nr:unnamed protein product [Adineta steineri]